MVEIKDAVWICNAKPFAQSVYRLELAQLQLIPQMSPRTLKPRSILGEILMHEGFIGIPLA